MGHGKVSISGDELFKYRIIMDYLEGRLSRLEVATKLKVSERTAKFYDILSQQFIATSELLHAELFESDGTVPNMTILLRLSS